MVVGAVTLSKPGRVLIPYKPVMEASERVIHCPLEVEDEVEPGLGFVVV